MYKYLIIDIFIFSEILYHWNFKRYEIKSIIILCTYLSAYFYNINHQTIEKCISYI